MVYMVYIIDQIHMLFNESVKLTFTYNCGRSSMYTTFLYLQIMKTLHMRKRFWKLTGEEIVGKIKSLKLLKLSNLRRNWSCDIIILQQPATKYS
jgi:hypothetical protein